MPVRRPKSGLFHVTNASRVATVGSTRLPPPQPILNPRYYKTTATPGAVLCTIIQNIGKST